MSRRVSIATVTALAAWVASAPLTAATGTGPPAAGTFEIHAIDVGSGLSIFVEGRDFTLLYDAGSLDDRARGDDNRVIAYLRAIRPDLQVIDHLILSHPHSDHVDLMPDVFARYRVRHVWNSGAFNGTCGYRAFLMATAAEPDVQYHDTLDGPEPYAATFREQHCNRQTLPADTIRVPRSSRITRRPVPLGENARMTILHPDGPPGTNLNAVSIVARLQLGPRSILLPGDIEGGRRAHPSERPEPDSVEAKLIRCCKSKLRSDILVAAHHGSRTSSRTAFLNAVKARQFIVSAGPRVMVRTRNPDVDVVMEMEKRGTAWRTDDFDFGCATEAAKVGRDKDGKPGGCDNVRIVIGAGGGIEADYYHPAD